MFINLCFLITSQVQEQELKEIKTSKKEKKKRNYVIPSKEVEEEGRLKVE